MKRNLPSFFNGVSCSYTPTSSYVSFEEIPGTGRNLVLEVYLTPSTGTEPIDLRLVQAMPRLDGGTSDLVFNFAATTYEQQTSSFTISTTKNSFAFTVQARQSTNATDFATSVQAKWISIS